MRRRGRRAAGAGPRGAAAGRDDRRRGRLATQASTTCASCSGSTTTTPSSSRASPVDPLLGESVRQLRGLRPLRTGTVAQALLRAVAGQLIQASRAREIERRIVRATTPRLGDLHAPPTRGRPRTALARSARTARARRPAAPSARPALPEPRPRGAEAPPHRRGRRRGSAGSAASGPGRSASSASRASVASRSASPGISGSPKLASALWGRRVEPRRPTRCSRPTASGRASRASTCSPDTPGVSYPWAMPSPPELHVLDDPAGHGRRPARRPRRGRGGSIVLTGGSTPRRRLRACRRSQPDWSAVTVWWGDERCVPPDDERSNFRLAEESLLAHLEVPPREVHRIRGELPPADAAARARLRARGRRPRPRSCSASGPTATSRRSSPARRNSRSRIGERPRAARPRAVRRARDDDDARAAGRPPHRPARHRRVTRPRPSPGRSAAEIEEELPASLLRLAATPVEVFLDGAAGSQIER